MESMRAWGTVAKAWYIEWSPWLAAAFGLFLIALLSGAMLVGPRRFFSDPLTIQWASAIATASATVAAVAIAARSSRERARERSLEGMLRVHTLNAVTGTWATTIYQARSDFDANLGFQPSTVKELHSLEHELAELDIEKIAAHDAMVAACISIAIGQIRFTLAFGRLAETPDQHAVVMDSLNTIVEVIGVITRRTADAVDSLQAEISRRLGESISNYIQRTKPKIVRTENPAESETHGSPT
ncbi:hypothetical protein ACRS9B_12120 [Achromobacter xylosoxidans]|uniref:hypothetical protein n=1 Tax=Alcaligenes xylosoxydans xylosoxydans TaxID=85698 RepID=UPI003EE22D74